MTANEGKESEHLNEWSLCCSLIVQKQGVMTCLFLCNLRPQLPASSCR